MPLVGPGPGALASAPLAAPLLLRVIASDTRLLAVASCSERSDAHMQRVALAESVLPMQSLIKAGELSLLL